jgi:hypothetical protein
MGPDLNATTLTGEVMKPVAYSCPWSFIELAIRSGASIVYLSVHVPTPAYLHLLEEVTVGDRLYVAGELAYSKSDHLVAGGQHCLKVREIRRLSVNGRVLEATPELPATHADVVGDRRRRRRGRRGAPQERTS